MNNFDKTKRSVWLKEEYFLEHKGYLKKIKEKNVFQNAPPEWLKTDPKQVDAYYKRLSWDQCLEAMALINIVYSSGEYMNIVVQETTEMLERFDKHHSIDFKNDKYYLWEPDSYIYILWLLGLAVLSDNKEILQHIPTWIGGEDSNDPNPIPYVDKPIKALLDLIGYQGELRVAEKDLFPKSCYRYIPEIIEADDIKRPELLKKYLKEWYKSNRNTYWYNSHKDNNGKFFFGYWSFEAGALAYLLNIDTKSSEINYSEFFPTDYVAWARNHK